MNLHNILIVDDESFIVDWLASLLEAQNDLNVYIYRAYTPARAMELIERTRIDLLISDIQMPAYTGFDLAEKLHQLWPTSKTILLTAFSDFNYAQEAIRQGITSYVLKTADDSEILSETRKALRAIDSEYNQLTLINHIEKDLKTFQTRLNSQTFFLWIRGYYSAANLWENIDTLGFSQQPNRFMLVICRADTFDRNDSSQLQNRIKPFQIQRIMEHYLAPHLTHSFYELQSDLLLGILQLHAETKNASHVISSSLELVQDACSETLKCQVSYLISPEGTAEDLPSFWSKGKSLLSRFSDESAFVFSYGNNAPKSNVTFSKEEDQCNQLLKQSYYNSMKRHLENGDQDAFMDQLDQVCAYLSQNANWHNNISLQIYFSLILVLINFINLKELSSQVSFHASTGLLFRPWHAQSWTEIEDNLYKMAKALFLLKKKVETDNENHIVQKIQDYIDEHITEDISLLNLSDITGYSTSYLSKYYSITTGTTISEYMAEKKLQRITQLMMETDLNIGEISSFMGFHSRTYFNNYINRLTGMSPQKYRESLSQHSE